MKLFDDLIDSPVGSKTTDWDVNELAEVITPYSKSVETREELTADFSVSTLQLFNLLFSEQSCFTLLAYKVCIFLFIKKIFLNTFIVQ